MTILGISAFYHDAAAAIIRDGEIIAAAQEERFTRKKNDASFPVNAVKFCLDYAGTSISDLNAVVFYDKPFLKFERILESIYAFSPRSLVPFLASMPVWIKEKLFLKKVLFDQLKEIEDFDKSKVKLFFPEHHLSHAASAFYPSPYQEAAILTIDGVGEWATTSICHGEGNQIKVLRELHYPHSVGLLYSSFTYYCGFKVNSGEYKLMGLAPYGNKHDPQTQKFVDVIKSTLVDIKEDGSIFLDQSYFNYATGLRMTNNEKWQSLFGLPPRRPESELDQNYCNLALACQIVTEEIVIKLAKEAKRLTGSKYLCMAGGVALNCVANGKIDDLKIFDEIFIQPASGDAGEALGAALAVHHISFDQTRSVNDHDTMKGSYLGTEYSNDEVQKMIHRRKAVARFVDDTDLLREVSQLLAEGKVIGWHQGRMEYGPRALGSRSILGDARNPDMQKKLNIKIKFREGFRPFAPIVIEEDASNYFDLDIPSPYMLLVKPVKEERLKKLPEGFQSWGIMDKLHFQRSDISAVTHVDYSARIQTVHKETNPRLYRLLQEFKKLTGYSVLINTSFNVRGEPVVNTPDEAYSCFMDTDMDWLVINNFLFDKSQQPESARNKNRVIEAD